MKKVTIMVVALMLSVATLFASNQQTKSGNNKTQSATDHYTCPMHKDVIGKKNDKCPKCGMKLEKKVAAACACSTCKDAVCKKCPKCSNKAQNNGSAKCVCPTCKDMKSDECSNCSKCCDNKKLEKKSSK